MTQSSDIVIVGAGLIGSLTALELAGRGVSVTVIEHQHVGAEASGSAAGILAPGLELLHDRQLFAIGMESLALHQVLAEVLRVEYKRDVDFRRSEIVRFENEAEPTEQALVTLKALEEHGTRASLIKGKELHDYLAGLAESRTWALRIEDQAKVDSAQLTAASFSVAQRRGARFLLGVDIEKIENDGERCIGVRTREGELISAGQVLIAAGSWASAIEGIPIPKHSVVPVKGQLLQVSAPDVALAPMLFLARSYIIPKADGTLLLGSTEEHSGFNKNLTVAGAETILRNATSLLPALEHAQVLTQWAGLRPASPDEKPILGQTSLRGCWIATAHYRHGILLGPWTARVMADALLNNDETKIPDSCHVRRLSA